MSSLSLPLGFAMRPWLLAAPRELLFPAGWQPGTEQVESWCPWLPKGPHFAALEPELEPELEPGPELELEPGPGPGPAAAVAAQQLAAVLPPTVVAVEKAVAVSAAPKASAVAAVVAATDYLFLALEPFP